MNRNRVRRSNSLHALGLMSPDESLDGLGLRARDSQCWNTLGGSDTKHPAASSISRLLRTTTEYLGESDSKRDRSLCETALLFTSDLCLGRQRHHHVHGRQRHDTRHYMKSTNTDQWLRDLKLLVAVGLWP